MSGREPPAGPAGENEGHGSWSRLVRAAWGFYVRRVPVVALTFGAVLRLEQYLFRRSLWMDESHLAISIVGRSYGELTQPLEAGQVAPVGFLWIERFFVSLFGNNEYALRLFPLLAGLASLALFHRLAKRLLSHAIVPVADILFAVSPFLVYFSNEAKQYSGDVLATLIVLNVGHGLLHATEVRKRDAFVFGVLGVTLTWVSHPVVLVMAGAGATVIASHALAKRWSSVTRLAIAGSAWTVSFAANWVLMRRYVEANERTLDFWRDGYPTQVSGFGEGLRWLGRRAVEMMENPAGLTLPILGLILCGVGIASFVQRRRAWDVLLMCSAVPVTVAAAALRVYPIRWRLLLFLVPLLLLLLAASADWAARRRWRPLVAGMLVPLAIITAAPMRTAGRNLASPPSLYEPRPVLEHIAAGWRAGDGLYVYGGSGWAYVYYGPILGLDLAGGILARNELPCRPGWLRELDEAKRVWVFFADRPGTRGNEHSAVRSLMDVVAAPVSGFIARGSAAYLYDPHAPPPDPRGLHVVQNPSISCLGARRAAGINDSRTPPAPRVTD